ncbi:anti-phage defense-associated sirtuin Dsr1 [Pantoea sp. ME81]|uniref:anti-phage defense-associated sirtuin Dsr1 n=1 Tax=Pantoea sp. ME81 TaxID=2743935 RepID=UPI0015F38773|nr:anti-phage defense-associated sirtuin Dsr1 [Pantoea sp. ME81]
MQFVKNGPDIPDLLLRAHEEGKVIFFCGAGISVPAGLPGFGKLVEIIYELTGRSSDPIEKRTLTKQQYDATLNLIERRLPGGRIQMRKALVQALTKKSWPRKATDTHEALLKLAKTRSGQLRLVTTNFDPLFEQAGKRIKQTFESFSAPMLPVPKKSRWNGLVYLHGAITPKMDDHALNRLVVTSGDFGLAYLTERWAARFVSELFRNYVICFVGYSIDDPVLRYMMDALAADKRQGEATQAAWAFAAYSNGCEREMRLEWEAKGVIPIMYNDVDDPAQGADHVLLHRTLKKWAETYHEGVTGKERIVIDYAMAQPSRSTVQDDFVGRMLWALSDSSGLPARRLAEHNPAPPVDWLFDGLMLNNFHHDDLQRFNVIPHEEADEKLSFSLISRPATYRLSPWMTLFSLNKHGTGWDHVMESLANWLLRYLNEPRLLLMLANGGNLHPLLNRIITRQLAYLSRLASQDKTVELEKIKADSPQAIPTLLMNMLWGLLLNGRVKGSRSHMDVYSWMTRLNVEGLSATMRFELRELLAPKIILQEPYDLSALNGEARDQTTSPTHVRDLVHWELALTLDSARSILDIDKNTRFKKWLPALFDDLQQLLKDALDLAHMMGGADKQSDSSVWAMPSISAHAQNQRFKDWTLLIELLRDAWLGLLSESPVRAARVATDWFEQPYPTFKRLAFFAAAHSDVISTSQWVSWLTDNDHFWLWSVDTGREVLRLLVIKGKDLGQDEQERLEAAILQGPPADEDSDGENPEHIRHYLNRRRWLYLAKLQSSGLPLENAAAETLQTLREANPKWKLAEDERDEFSVWTGNARDDSDDEPKFSPAPGTLPELVSWLKTYPQEQRFFGSDGWREQCSKQMKLCLKALQLVGEDGEIPVWRWREALQAWSKDDMLKRSWRAAAPVVVSLPDEVLLELKHSLAWWIEACSKTLERHIGVFRKLCQRMLNVPFEAQSGTLVNGKPIDDPVSEAINHPVGYVTEALVHDLFRGEKQDGDLLPVWLKPLFTQLCQPEIARFRHGRVILAANLISLFRVDPDWTKQNLLPLFSWEHSPEARAVWEGFLWSPRLYKPLFDLLRGDFIETAAHYASLGKHGEQYATLLTYVALDMAEAFSEEELRNAFHNLPDEGLLSVAQALGKALSGAGEGQQEAYWINRIEPFWRKMWPQNQDRRSSGISDRLVQLVLASGQQFPAAFHMVKNWLQPAEFLFYLVPLLEKSGLCHAYPSESLELLALLVAEPDYPPEELRMCLNQIAEQQQGIKQNESYIRLDTLLRTKKL